MGGGYDFLAQCTPGLVLRTRDRRDARITAVERDARVIRGEVAMIGACAWRGDGVYLDAPLGAAGPLDLLPPGPDPGPVPVQRRVKVADQISAEGRGFCCD